GCIETPFFVYSIEVGFEDNDPQNTVWSRKVSRIVEPARIFAGPFEQIFERRFNQLQFDFPFPLNLEAIVDHVEESELEATELEYDKNLEWCEISFLDLLASIFLESHSIFLTDSQDSSPVQMFEKFSIIQSKLFDSLAKDDFLVLANP
ncbi:MAG: hypothetical protein AAF623_19675, partial [Planctomycetota bacterium]